MSRNVCARAACSASVAIGSVDGSAAGASMAGNGTPCFSASAAVEVPPTHEKGSKLKKMKS